MRWTAIKIAAVAFLALPLLAVAGDNNKTDSRPNGRAWTSWEHSMRLGFLSDVRSTGGLPLQR
jgi:hypothetical protein